MTINNGDTTDVAGLSLDRTIGSREVDTKVTAQPAHTEVEPIDDRIALSIATKLVQQATLAGEQARLNRILELKNAIQTRQYIVDPLAVGHAVIEAHLLGE